MRIAGQAAFADCRAVRGAAVEQSLALVHVVQHLFGAFSPDLIVSTVAEETDTDDDVAFEGKTLLRFKELLHETCATAKGYDGVFADHIISQLLFSGMP